MVCENMRRRTLLRAGGSIAFVALAGCSGDDGDESESDTTTEEASSGDTTETSGGGDVSYSVEPSANQLDWGEDYSVSVTVEAGDESVQLATGIVFQTEDDQQWAGSFGNTEKMWQLEAGESESATFDVEPPTVGELRLGLYDAASEQVVEDWELAVTPPTAAFGGTNSYYDGLDVTLDVELTEWMDFELDYEDESGTYAVRPQGGQWVKVTVAAENTNTNSEVRLFGDDAFTALGGSSQLDRPRSLGEDVGAGTNYEIADQTRHEEGAWMEMYKDGNAQQEGYWYPPSELISGSAEEGWFVLEAESDTTKADLQIRLERSDIRATWEGM